MENAIGSSPIGVVLHWWCCTGCTTFSRLFTASQSHRQTRALHWQRKRKALGKGDWRGWFCATSQGGRKRPRLFFRQRSFWGGTRRLSGNTRDRKTRPTRLARDAPPPTRGRGFRPGRERPSKHRLYKNKGQTIAGMKRRERVGGSITRRRSLQRVHHEIDGQEVNQPENGRRKQHHVAEGGSDVVHLREAKQGVAQAIEGADWEESQGKSGSTWSI